MPKKIIKKIIEPFQRQLLNRGMCVACTMPLKKSINRNDRGDGTEKVTCKCGRIFIYKSAENSYRRAEFNEL